MAADAWADLGGDLDWIDSCGLEAAIDLNLVLMPRPIASFLMRVSGDAMGEAGIHHGDLLVIDRSLQPEAGAVVVAVEAGRFVLRWLERASCGAGWRLAAADPAVPPIHVQHDDPDLLIWGVVLHAVHHLIPGAGGGGSAHAQASVRPAASRLTRSPGGAATAPAAPSARTPHQGSAA